MPIATPQSNYVYSHNRAAALLSWAAGCDTACSEGCVIAASAARFCMFIWGSRPAAAAAAADSALCAFRPGKYMSGVVGMGVVGVGRNTRAKAKETKNNEKTCKTNKQLGGIKL